MKSAVYAGTFDPVTRGHLSVIQRGSQLFDALTVLVADNPEKRPLFSLAERLHFLRDATRDFPGVEIASTSGLVVEYARATGSQFLVRGVRGATDADYEAWLAAANLKLAPSIQTIFLPADPELSKLSSSRLKELAAARADISAYATPLVASALAALAPREEENHV